MISPDFVLTPFPGEANPPGVTIVGSIARRAGTLSFRCEVRGDLAKVAIPSRAGSPRRKHRLWEGTCVELFFGTADSGGYREINFSPAGHWNVYRFDGYREGMREEETVSSLPFEVRKGPEALVFTAEIGIGTIVPPGADVAANVAAVIEAADGGKSHWALRHPGARPDFHRRDGFVWTLPGETGEDHPGRDGGAPRRGPVRPDSGRKNPAH